MANAKLFALALVAILPTALAQTYTECNPLEKTCPDDPALAGTYSKDFQSQPSDFMTISGPSLITYDAKNGATFTIDSSGNAPTIRSNFYIMGGEVQASIKPAPGVGIVSSLVLQSDDLDELDWEWLGAYPGQVHSNYFGKGNTDSYDREKIHQVDNVSDWHTYGFKWTQNQIDWIINGQVVRTLNRQDAQSPKGDFFPQTPMQLRIGSWSGGDPANTAGTIQWSGGTTDYTKGPFKMFVKDVKIVDYSTGTAYRYGDRSGSWSSIKSIGGKIGVGPQTGLGNQGNIPLPAGAANSSNPQSSKIGLLIPTSSVAADSAKAHPIGILAILGVFLFGLSRATI